MADELSGGNIFRLAKTAVEPVPRRGYTHGRVSAMRELADFAERASTPLRDYINPVSTETLGGEVPSERYFTKIVSLAVKPLPLIEPRNELEREFILNCRRFVSAALKTTDFSEEELISLSHPLVSGARTTPERVWTLPLLMEVLKKNPRLPNGVITNLVSGEITSDPRKPFEHEGVTTFSVLASAAKRGDQRILPALESGRSLLTLGQDINKFDVMTGRKIRQFDKLILQLQQTQILDPGTLQQPQRQGKQREPPLR